MLLQSQPARVAVHWAGDSASLAIEAPICNHATAVQRAWRATDVSRRELWYLCVETQHLQTPKPYVPDPPHAQPNWPGLTVVAAQPCSTLCIPFTPIPPLACPKRAHQPQLSARHVVPASCPVST